MGYRDIFSLDGKRAFVAGAGGLGLEIAKALLESGADVAAADLDPKKADSLAGVAKAEGRRLLQLPMDVLDSASIERAVQEAVAQLGGIDILVNAVGINALKKAEEYDEDTWDRVMDINIKGTHLVTKAVGIHMIKQEYGRILNLSSVRSIVGMPRDYLAYCASKGAVNLYTKQIACEWARYGITCNAVAPTFIRTPLNSFQLDDPVFYQKLVDRIPLGRICSATDLAAAAVFLCSDAAAFITGQVLCIDGGLTSIQ